MLFRSPTGSVPGAPSDLTVAPNATPLARAWLAASIAATVGALVGAALAAPPDGVRVGDGLMGLLFVGYAMHVASTGWLAGLDAVRSCARQQPVRFVVVPVSLVALGVAVVPVLGVVALQLCLEGFFAWQLFHFTKQNVGIATLASMSSGAGPLRAAERRCLLATGWCGVVAFLARPSLLDLRDVPASPLVFHAAMLGFALAAGIGLLALARRPARAQPLGFMVCAAVSMCFTTPMYVVGSPYGAIGGMTIAHGLQYLILIGLIAVRRGEGTRRWSSVATLGAVALLGGLALRATSHLSASEGLSRVAFGLYLGLVGAHFVVDAGLWRLSNPGPRRFVVGALPDLMGPGRAAVHVDATRS
ncbi:MAG TPA: hypothetical protein VMQ40_06540 [Acidimicrobiales bacterium]|jgi:hypothetical protein|nr:hypothetical protein [Acidimicrobiales bacterium]